MIFRAVRGTSPAESYQPIARSWDFSNARVVADLGGGGGAIMKQFWHRSPRCVAGWLTVQTRSMRRSCAFRPGALGERLQLVATDLSKEVPTGADVHVLKHMLHGYADDAAIQILRNCRTALPVEGRILIVEFCIAGRD